MHPLLTTWSPILYTDYGYENYKNWIEVGGFDNVTFKQNGKAMKLLTKLSIENLLHPLYDRAVDPIGQVAGSLDLES